MARVHVDRAVAAASSSRGTCGCEPGNCSTPRQKRVVVRRHDAVLQRGQRDERLDRRARRVDAAQRAVDTAACRCCPQRAVFRPVRPRAKPFGSKLGVLTSASTSPLRGSIATTAARCVAERRLRPPAAARGRSSRYRSLPAIGSLRSQVRRRDADALDAPTLRIDQELLVAVVPCSSPRSCARCRACRSASCRRTSRRRCVPGPVR